MTKENYQQWRFWPLICLAFLYLINVALINLATPLYFFKQGTEIVIIGFLVVGSTITYCFSPILLYKLSKKLGGYIISNTLYLYASYSLVFII